jgi:hypothetical protein
MHRLVVEVEECSIGLSWLLVIRPEPILADAIVCAVREVEGHGYKVTGIRTVRWELREATRLVLGLRALAPHLSEEELALLLDLLPL